MPVSSGSVKTRNKKNTPVGVLHYARLVYRSVLFLLLLIAYIRFRLSGTGDVTAQLRELVPDGVNVFFDNVGGAVLDAVLDHLALRARVVICGTASIANWNPPPQGPRVERHLLVKRARMQGFVMFDHDDHLPRARRDIAGWLREGRLVYREDILEGIEQAPDAIAGLYRGENLGKRLIRLK